MTEQQYPWGHQRRFNSYAEYIKQTFGGRVQKLTIDAGFTCPNRDGKLGWGGCTYCNNNAFNPSYCDPGITVSQQIKKGMTFHKSRYRRARNYLAYFQAYTNTYAPVDHLKALYEEALAFPEVVGLVIGTRPDCVNDEILNLLAGINQHSWVTVEYGIESCFDETLERINRGHDFAKSLEALKMTRKKGIRTGGHMIVGLPGEGREEILESARILSGLPLNQVKFHQLQIVKGTIMEQDYRLHPEHYHHFEPEEYLELMADVVEHLDPEIIIERIAGETVPGYQVRPGWGMRYDQVLQQFEKILEKRDSWQGKVFSGQAGKPSG